MSDDSMIEEFKIEAQEMFETSEDGFLKIEKGEDFIQNYNLIFRAFHSLKGAAGMFGIEALQSHMHKLESLFEAQKVNGKLDKAQIDYFLNGIDVAKSLLEGGEAKFQYYTVEEFKKIASSSAPVEVKPEIKSTSALIPKKNPVEKTVFKKERGLFYIVDDEQQILDILEGLITELNFAVRTFTSAKELLDVVEEDSPDVILSDIKMPEMTGDQLLKEIRKMEIDTPVIFISGFISKEVMLDALSNGAYGFIEKPFNEVYLKSICDNAFEKSMTKRLLQKSINYILYQFSDLDNYLKDQGKDSLRISLKQELTNILDQQKKLKALK
jgi:FixJ family two-component response regulator